VGTEFRNVYELLSQYDPNSNTDPNTDPNADSNPTAANHGHGHEFAAANYRYRHGSRWR
jgi:hypothetical protein